MAFCLAVAAASLIKVPALFGLRWGEDEGFYARNLSLFVLPLLTGYFAWKRGLDVRTILWLAVAFVGAGVFANLYPFGSRITESATEVLTVLHLPIALWLVVGIAYAGTRWRAVGGRMDFIRFSGELFIYYVLVAAAVRGHGGRSDRVVARGGQAERDREHGAGADAPLHAALRRCTGSVSGDSSVDRARHCGRSPPVYPSSASRPTAWLRSARM